MEERPLGADAALRQARALVGVRVEVVVWAGLSGAGGQAGLVLQSARTGEGCSRKRGKQLVWSRENALDTVYRISISRTSQKMHREGEKKVCKLHFWGEFTLQNLRPKTDILS